MQVVEGFPLHPDQSVVAALERKLFRHVLVDQRDTAIGARFGDDVPGAPVGQMPPVLAVPLAAIAGELLRLPAAIIRFARHQALLTQAVEDLAVAGAAGQPLGLDLP